VVGQSAVDIGLGAAVGFFAGAGLAHWLWDVWTDHGWEPGWTGVKEGW
jgi:hypothetical protein